MLSFSQIRDMLTEEVKTAENNQFPYILGMSSDSVIYEVGGSYFKRTYAIVDGKVTLGDAVKVEKKIEYTPLQAAGRMLAAVGDSGADDYGYKWRVQVVEYGMGKDGRINWPAEPIKAAMGLYEGARVFALNDSQHQDPKTAKTFGKSVREIVGWISNVTDTGKGLEGDLNILKAANWLRDMLVDSFERGKTDLLGLSHDVTAITTEKMVAGKKVKEPVEIKSVQVDVVYEPTNNGQFLRMAAAVQAGREEEEMKQKLLAALQKARPDQYATVDKEKVTEDELLTMLAAAPSAPEGLDEKIQAAVQAAVKGLTPPAGQGENPELKKMQLLAAGMTLDRELASSGLPDLSQGKLRKQFEGKIVETETLQAAIKDEKEYVDKLTGSGAVTGSGEVRVVRESGEKLQAACDKMLGVKVADSFSDVRPLESIRAAYTLMTGDTEVRGFEADPAKLRRLQAAFDSTTFSYVLGNTLYRRLVQDYKEVSDYGLSRLVSNKRNAKDFRTLESIRIAYFGDLPDVTPETIDYADLGTLSDERVSYTLNQKGGIVTITRAMIINDDMSAIQKILNRLPRAARRTVAKRGWNKFINNATYKGDSVATFHASHNNLGSTALSTTSLVAAIKGMKAQTEPGSSEKLMLRAKTLAIPTDLWDTALKINRTQGEPGANTFGNAVYQYFGADDSGIVEVPFMTDVNDWMLFGDPNEVEILEIAYLNGQETPEMFVADNPASGQFFQADKIQYKIRHEYEVEVVDFRGAYKAVVAG